MVNLHFSLLPRWRGAAPGGAGHPGRRRGHRRLRHGAGGGTRHRPRLRLGRAPHRARRHPRRAAGGPVGRGDRAAAAAAATTACPSPGPQVGEADLRGQDRARRAPPRLDPAGRAPPPGGAPGPGVDHLPGPAPAGRSGPGWRTRSRAGSWPRASSTRPPSRWAPAGAGRWPWWRCSPRAGPPSRPPPGATAPASNPATASARDLSADTRRVSMAGATTRLVPSLIECQNPRSREPGSLHLDCP